MFKIGGKQNKPIKPGKKGRYMFLTVSAGGVVGNDRLMMKIAATLAADPCSGSEEYGLVLLATAAKLGIGQ